MKWIETLTLFFCILFFTVCLDFVLAALVMWIWNMIVPVVFTGVSMLTYWQAFGLMVLVSLFKVNFNFNNKKE